MVGFLVCFCLFDSSKSKNKVVFWRHQSTDAQHCLMSSWPLAAGLLGQDERSHPVPKLGSFPSCWLIETNTAVQYRIRPEQAFLLAYSFSVCGEDKLLVSSRIFTFCLHQTQNIVCWIVPGTSAISNWTANTLGLTSNSITWSLQGFPESLTHRGDDDSPGYLFTLMMFI